jgi:hypothetical protein
MSNQSESIQIHLDSYYATVKRNNNSADCMYQLPIINTARDNYLHLSLISMIIPYSFYNINTSNNIFRFNLLSGDEIALIVPPGNYNINQLVLFLNTSMGNNMRCSYNSVSNKMTFSNDATTFMIISNDFSRILGFPSTTLFATSTTAPYCVNLYTITNINVETNLLTYNYSNVPNEQTTNTILANIPVLTQPMGLIGYENKGDYRVNLYVGEMTTLSIRLRDNRGNIIDMNGCDYTMSIQIDTVPF